VKPDWNTSVQGLRNVLADKRLFLPTVGRAIDLPRIAHEEIVLTGTEWNGDG
jgi:hypothetical protein